MYISICTLRFTDPYLQLFPRKSPNPTLNNSDFRYCPEKFLTSLKSFPQENSSDRKTDHATEHKIKRDKIDKDYPGQERFWKKTILGCFMSSVDERELAEVRMIEEGLRKAYDGDAKGVVDAFSSLRDFAVQLIHLDLTAENELDAKALIIAMGDIGKLTAEKRMEIASIAAVHSLGEVAVEAADRKRESLALKALSGLGGLALEFAEKGMDAVAKNAAETLGNLGKKSLEAKMEVLASLSETYLMQLARKAMDENLPETWATAVNFLVGIGVSSAGQEMENSSVGSAILLEELGIAAVRKRNEPQVKVIIEALEKLGKELSRQESKNALVQTVWTLETLRVLALEYGMETAVAAGKLTLEALNTTGIPDEEQNLERIQEIKELHRRILKRS
ncbi:predicted protein [Methanosarcina acetivorans C2A]|uniref:Uncharacterized protein n=2 Tax=Methanosarcina acetivorans TaxID=2214 RepID=Q8TQX1_METAC|nr:predicted protein [Methanosarcina acetivorans C2A]